MNEFILGMVYLQRGFPRLFTDGLKRFILLPIAFNLLLFGGLFYVFYDYVFPYSDYFLIQLPSWLHFLSTVFLIVFFVSGFLLFLSYPFDIAGEMIF